jgi:hypothetical protein
VNNPKTIANTIKSMMLDINAEVVIADLIEQGFDIEKLLVKHDGLFKRNFSKDISDIYYDMVKDLLILHISHDSFYDVLPGGLFHHIFSDFNPENRRLEFEKLKEEEKNARKFFLPFDDEFFMQYVKLELTLRKYFKNPDRFIHHLLLFGKKIPGKYSTKLSSYLLFADKIIGNAKLTALCLSDILGHDIRHSAYNVDDNINYFSNNIDTKHSESSAILGGNYICGDSVAEDRIVWEFSILLEDDKAVEKYIERENKQIKEILKIFFEYFIPIEIEVMTNIICNKSNPFVIGEDYVDKNMVSAEIQSNSYLGYNMII